MTRRGVRHRSTRGYQRTHTTNDVQAPVDVRVKASIDDLERELDRKVEQAKSEILREVQQADTTSGISSRQQQSFQRRT